MQGACGFLKGTPKYRLRHSRNRGKERKVTAMASKHSRNGKMHREEQENYFELLPKEITTEILSRLPLPNVFQVQNVCRSWRTTICSSTQFQKMWDEKNSEQWIVMDDCDGGVEIFNISGELKKKMFDSANWRLKDANGGLLLYQHKTEGLFQVVNPLTMEARQFPDPILGKEHLSLYLRTQSSAVNLIVDSTTKTYQVLLFVGFDRTLNLLIFRSTTSSWETKPFEFSGETVRCEDWAPYKTVGNQTVHCFPLEGHALASYNLCGEIVHAKKKYSRGLKGLMTGQNVKLATWAPPIGRTFVFIFELDEASSQWRVVSVCRAPSRKPFGQLLCEKDFVLSCLGASKDCIWIMPAFSDEDVKQTMLMLHQQKDVFNNHRQDKSRAFPMPLIFSLCP